MMKKIVLLLVFLALFLSSAAGRFPFLRFSFSDSHNNRWSFFQQKDIYRVRYRPGDTIAGKEQRNQPCEERLNQETYGKIYVRVLQAWKNSSSHLLNRDDASGLIVIKNGSHTHRAVIIDSSRDYYDLVTSMKYFTGCGPR
jgi:hypothetical protein